MVSRIYSLLPGACTYLCRRRSAAPRPHPSPKLSFAAVTRRVHVQPPNTHLLQNTFFPPCLSLSVREIVFPRSSDIFFFSPCCPIFLFLFLFFFFYLRTVTILLFVIWPVCGDGPTIDPSLSFGRSHTHFSRPV